MKIFEALFIFVFIYIIFSGIKQYSENSKCPIITVEARVIDKDQRTTTHMHNNNGTIAHHHNTTYYVTFKTEHDEEISFSISRRFYNDLTEGDYGNLTYQRTWFKDFKKISFGKEYNEENFEDFSSIKYKEY
ncbi:DUF2500 domain-containing protein [Clostridium tetani]|nr:DUF2500 domain-containing protein [Clostridium tetani]